MKPRIRILAIVIVLVALSVATRGTGQAQTVPLFFHEGWEQANDQEETAPLVPDMLENADLEMMLLGPGVYAPGKDAENSLNLSVRQRPTGETWKYVWSGMTESNWAVMLKHKDSYVDLTGPGAKVRLRSFQDGSVHVVRLVLKLADGTYVLGLEGAGTTADYAITDHMMAEMTWVDFDPVLILDRASRESSFGYANPDLSRVDEIGFTTLSRGGGHGTGVSAHVDWIEVYGTAVPRE